MQPRGGPRGAAPVSRAEMSVSTYRPKQQN